MNKTPASRNEGIQATSVQADVMAVGRGARAVKQAPISDQAALRQAVADLRAAIARLDLSTPARQALDEDVRGLDAAVRSPSPDAGQAKRHLESIGGKLTMVGKVMGQIADLQEPALRIADLLRMSLGF